MKIYAIKKQKHYFIHCIEVGFNKRFAFTTNMLKAMWISDLEEANYFCELCNNNKTILDTYKGKFKIVTYDLLKDNE